MSAIRAAQTWLEARAEEVRLGHVDLLGTLRIAAVDDDPPSPADGGYVEITYSHGPREQRQSGSQTRSRMRESLTAVVVAWLHASVSRDVRHAIQDELVAAYQARGESFSTPGWMRVDSVRRESEQSSRPGLRASGVIVVSIVEESVEHPVRVGKGKGGRVVDIRHQPGHGFSAAPAAARWSDGQLVPALATDPATLATVVVARVSGAYLTVATPGALIEHVNHGLGETLYVSQTSPGALEVDRPASGWQQPIIQRTSPSQYQVLTSPAVFA